MPNQHRRSRAQSPLLDTNILLYSISRDPTETTKHDRAVALIDAGDNARSVQVLQEFYARATRPTRPDPLPHDIAAGLIRTWLRFKVQDVDRLQARGLFVRRKNLKRVSDGYVHRRKMSNVARQDC